MAKRPTFYSAPLAEPAAAEAAAALPLAAPLLQPLRLPYSRETHRERRVVQPTTQANNWLRRSELLLCLSFSAFASAFVHFCLFGRSSVPPYE